MSRFIATMVVIALVVGVFLAVAGVIHFQNGPDRATVTLDKKDLNEKTQEAVKDMKRAGGDILNKTGDALHRAAAGVRGSSPEQDRQATKTSPDEKKTR